MPAASLDWRRFGSVTVIGTEWDVDHCTSPVEVLIRRACTRQASWRALQLAAQHEAGAGRRRRMRA